MYNTLKEMYRRGSIDATGLAKAVALKWITQEQMDEIIATTVVDGSQSIEPTEEVAE